MTQEADTKKCIICGNDCTDVARVKDGRGRYACKSCYDKHTRKDPIVDDALAETKVDQDALEDTGFDQPSQSVAGLTAATTAIDFETDLDRGDPGDTAAAALPDPKADALPCLSCGVDMPADADTCPACGARPAPPEESVKLDRLTAMGFLFTEDGAWHHGSKMLVAIMAGLGILSTFVSGCLFASVVIFIMLAAAAWVWSVYAAWADRDRGWAAALVFAYPILGPGSIVAFYHALLVTRRVHLKRFHQLLIVCGLIVAAAWGVRMGTERGTFHRLYNQIVGPAAESPEERSPPEKP